MSTGALAKGLGSVELDLQAIVRFLCGDTGNLNQVLGTMTPVPDSFFFFFIL